MKQTLERLLFRPISPYALAAFRIAFGAIVMWEVQRYLENDRLRRYWIEPSFHFPYEWFPWVKPWPEPFLSIHFLLLAVAALLMMAGLAYRAAAVFVFLSLTYVFLLEQALYLNHFYLVILFSFLMILVPAHRVCSVDAKIFPTVHRETVPAWGLLLLRFQMAAVYVFGGLAKLNYDWVVLGQPMRGWMAESGDFPLIGRYFSIPWVPHTMGTAAILIDLLAPILLFWRRSRPFMFAVLVAFHFMNDRLFQIGVFPWLAIAASTLFFPPDWPARAWASARLRPVTTALAALGAALAGIYFHRALELVPALIACLSGATLAWTFAEAFGTGEPVEAEPALQAGDLRHRRPVLAFVTLWVVVQTLMPLRHHFIPGEVGWTEEGHRFAWRMKLRSKSAYTTFYAYNPATEHMIAISPDTMLKPFQLRGMDGLPHMLPSLARHMVSRLREAGFEGYEIRVISYASLNGAPPRLVIPWGPDLSRVSYSDFSRNDWILSQEP
jgi:vitamin K-dependent gamma-carboxylase